MNNGDGLRVVLWLSGCSHYCKNCQNPQTHPYNSGILFDREAEKELFSELSKDYISGLTLTGGDPLFQTNLDGVLNLVNKINILLPNKTIWLYSGYTWEQCMQDPIRREIVCKCDVFVDGRYVDELRDITLMWRGSSNQRVIDVQASLKNEEVTLYSE